jgi:hypothetical protein
MKPIIGKVLGMFASPLTRLGEKYIDRKQNQDNLKAKAQLARQSDSATITLTDAEWETVGKQQEQDSCKDELATVVVLWPMIGIMLGAVILALTGDARLLEGTVAGVKALKELDVDMGELMLIVVLAAVSLKWWRSA